MNKQSLLFLLDIDGTLISTNGQAPAIMLKAVQEVLHKKVEFHIEDFIGRLDPLILASLLKRAGISESETNRYLSVLTETYLTSLERDLREEHIIVYDGVIQFIEYLKQNDIPYALLTGNLRAGAMIKLKKAGLWDYFSTGAFADDGPSRESLVPVARKRAEAFYQRSFPSDKIWVVGDSVNDIRCARANHCRSLIVLTGKSNPQKLKQAAPDILVRDLSDIPFIFNSISNFYTKIS